MNKEVSTIAVDFGASSGRVILGTFDGEKIRLEEIHRFKNEPVKVGGTLHWDFLRLFHEMKIGIKKALTKSKHIASIGIDTWGVDYGLIDKNNNLIGMPIHYRDERTKEVFNRVKDIVPSDVLYKRTGIQDMPINTIYQLYADKFNRPDILEKTKNLLFMPDLFNFYLTGEKHNEYSIASTSGMINPWEKKWDKDLLEVLGLPHNILSEPIMPGTLYGNLSEDICREIGTGSIPVIAVGCHDTASAVAGTPLLDENCAFLSCGTWSLLGIESEEPIVTDLSLKYNFTNEGGVGGSIRFLKNINGLWIIQQLRKNWSEKGKEISFPDIIEAARNVKNKEFCIDPADERFVSTPDMIGEIANYCEENGQGTPETLGEIAIAAYNGLARKYSDTVKQIEIITGKRINTINMIGGGIQDELLCSLTSSITKKRVITGPIEASVAGNILMQLIALGEIKNINEGRIIIKNSFKQREYV